MVPVQFTGTSMAVATPSQTAFPRAPQQLLIIEKQMRTLRFKRRFMTGKHMASRNPVWLLHTGPSAARQAIGVKKLTAQFVWQVWKADGLETVQSLGLQISFRQSGYTIATRSMKHVLVITFGIWTPQREVRMWVSLSSTTWKTFQCCLTQCLGSYYSWLIGKTSFKTAFSWSSSPQPFRISPASLLCLWAQTHVRLTLLAQGLLHPHFFSSAEVKEHQHPISTPFCSQTSSPLIIIFSDSMLYQFLCCLKSVEW